MTAEQDDLTNRYALLITGPTWRMFGRELGNRAFPSRSVTIPAVVTVRQPGISGRSRVRRGSARCGESPWLASPLRPAGSGYWTLRPGSRAL